MKKMIKLIILAILVQAVTLSATLSTTKQISQSGGYSFIGDLEFNPTGPNESMFHISADNVVLSLGGSILSLITTSTHAGIDAITTATGLKNITISSGIIDGMSGIGIRIGEGCTDVHIANIIVKNCHEAGILLDGTSGSRIVDGTISNCVVMTCTGAGGNPAYGLRMIECDNVGVNNCKFIKNDAGSTSSGSGLQLESCKHCHIGHCHAEGNGGTPLGAGFVAQDGSGNVFHDCLAYDNVSTTTAAGFALKGTEQHSCIAKCDSRLNDGGSGNGYGILLDGAQNCDIRENSLIGNTGLVGVGLKETAGSTTNFMTANRAFANATSNFDGVPLGSIKGPVSVSALNGITDTLSNIDII